MCGGVFLISAQMEQPTWNVAANHKIEECWQRRVWCEIEWKASPCWEWKPGPQVEPFTQLIITGQHWWHTLSGWVGVWLRHQYHLCSTCRGLCILVPGHLHFNLPFTFTIIHRSKRVVKNRKSLVYSSHEWMRGGCRGWGANMLKSKWRQVALTTQH